MKQLLLVAAIAFIPLTAQAERPTEYLARWGCAEFGIAPSDTRYMNCLLNAGEIARRLIPYCAQIGITERDSRFIPCMQTAGRSVIADIKHKQAEQQTRQQQFTPPVPQESSTGVDLNRLAQALALIGQSSMPQPLPPGAYRLPSQPMATCNTMGYQTTCMGW